MNIAKSNDNIRAVILYGSRADEDIDADKYQDYDVIYIVNDEKQFDFTIFDSVKLHFFPSRIYPELLPNENVYLMLFDNNERIDLSVCTLSTFYKNYSDVSPKKCLLDKDNIIHIDCQVDRNVIKPITKQRFEDTCSEFFWETQNMAKGLKRDQLSFALFIRDVALRDMFNRIVDTYIGIKNNYSVSVGTLGKYRKKYLSKEEYELYQNTYLSNTNDDRWNSLFYMMDLFNAFGKSIADKCGFLYPEEDEKQMRVYLYGVKSE
jgi:aminoglycoside 6-adenylyltransferase